MNWIGVKYLEPWGHVVSFSCPLSVLMLQFEGVCAVRKSLALAGGHRGAQPLPCVSDPRLPRTQVQGF